MNSHITQQFRDRFVVLSKVVQQEARQAFRQFQRDADHPGLAFKPVTGKHYWSERIGLHYRALGLKEHGNLYWFWIGTHAEYDKLLA